MTSIMSAPAASIMSDPILAEHAVEIRRLGQRAIAEVTAISTTAAVEIGRHLVEAKTKAGHGHFGQWLLREFNWSDRTARNFMHVYKLSLNNGNVSDLKLPMRELYLLAAPSTPEEAREEIIQRAEAGEQVSGAEVREVIARAKGENGTSNGDAAGDVVSPPIELEPDVEQAEQAEEAEPHAAASIESAPTPAPAPAEPAPDPATTAAPVRTTKSKAKPSLVEFMGIVRRRSRGHPRPGARRFLRLAGWAEHSLSNSRRRA